jgi:hypothetical protein
LADFGFGAGADLVAFLAAADDDDEDSAVGGLAVVEVACGLL